MGISKVYKGYVIEQDASNQWYIRNAPNWTNMNAFSPGPHPNWSVATHQVDKLIEYTNRSTQDLSGWSTKSNGGEQYTNQNYSSDSSDIKLPWIVQAIFNDIVSLLELIFKLSFAFLVCFVLYAVFS